MAVGTQSDITMHSGDTRNIVITIVDSTSTAVPLGSVTDLTWALSKKASDSVTPRGAAIVTKAIATGITVTDAPNGVISIILTPADTASLAGEYYHELQMTFGAAVSTVLFGKVTISKDLI